jgi:hypothetical protein
MRLIADPNPWVVWPCIGILVFLFWAIVHAIDMSIKKSRQSRESQRGFEVKLTGETPVLREKEKNDHG